MQQLAAMLIYMVQRKARSVRTGGTGESLIVTFSAYCKYNLGTDNQIHIDSGDAFL